MKCIKSGNRVNAKLTLPKDLPWKIFRCFARDLGADEYSHEQLFRIIRNRDIASLMDILPTFEPRCMLERFENQKSNSKLFFIDYQLGAFLKKFPFKGTDTKTPAIHKFEQAEEQCRLFNTENYKALLALNESHPDFLGIVEEIRADVLELLGEFPPINSIVDHAKHGPGVSLGSQYKEGQSTEYYKWSKLPYTVTIGALPYARAAIEADPRWMGALDQRYRLDNAIPLTLPINLDEFWNYVFEIVDSNRIASVPKTALTDRTIAIEPLMNVYFQLGVDNVIKILLRKKWGYDLSSQLRNQMYAEESSVTDLLVTYDLRGASDTIALMCCSQIGRAHV